MGTIKDPTVEEPDAAEALIEAWLEGDALEFESQLDRGGMGLIERVRDRHLDRVVARKVLAPNLAVDAKSVRYFLREAWVTAKLAHPAVVPVHALERDEEGRLYFTMKLVEGVDLAKRVESLGTGPVDQEQLFELLAIVLRVCEALELAHAEGIVHRDIKPDNVMIGAFGAVYLMDWGVAAPMPGGAEMPANLEVDDRGSAVGTPAYMAPEQATGIPADARTDVYGIGGLLYFILTRRAPHRGRSIMEVLQHAAYESVEPPTRARPEQTIPIALENVVLRALASRPDDRYASIAELAKELRRIMRGGGDFPRTRVRKGEHVVREGEAGDAAFIIVKGRLRVYRRVAGERRDLRVMRRGEVFGEMAILGSGLRTASVVAEEDCELLVVTKQTLQREVGDMKPWVGAIVRTLARRFEQRERELLEASAPSTRRVPALLDRNRVLQMCLLLAEGWCPHRGEGEHLLVRFGDLAREVAALCGVDDARLASMFEAHSNFELDAARDLVRIRDPAALRAKLRAALGR